MFKVVEGTRYGRFYDIGGFYVPSVTTVTKYGCPTPHFLLKYIIKQSEGDYDKYLTKTSEALRVGSLVHDNCEKLLNGEELFIENDKEVQKGVISFVKWYNEHKPKVLAVEEVLYSKSLKQGKLTCPFAGRCDLVAEIDGEVWMLDLKTSKSLNDYTYVIQLSMYKMLWDVLHPEQQIERLGLVHCKKDFMGSRPTDRTNLFKEVEFNKKAVEAAVYFFYMYEDAFDKQGVLKTFAKLETEFKL
tara:strand:- start:5042 stop:5773 length:732 start_codon:yes stop_codon:yes gene_type:complete